MVENRGTEAERLLRLVVTHTMGVEPEQQSPELADLALAIETFVKGRDREIERMAQLIAFALDEMENPETTAGMYLARALSKELDNKCRSLDDKEIRAALGRKEEPRG